MEVSERSVALPSQILLKEDFVQLVYQNGLKVKASSKPRRLSLKLQCVVVPHVRSNEPQEIRRAASPQHRYIVFYLDLY